MVKLILPQSEEPQIIAGLVYSLAQRFGEELGEYIHNKYSSIGQPDWFHKLRVWRESQSQKFVFDDFRDPRFILTEQLKDDSPLREVIPGWSKAWSNNGFALRKKLNEWSHHRASPTVHNLKTFSELLLTLVPGFEIEADTRALINRCKAILDGSYEASAHEPEAAPMDVAPEVKEVIERYEEVPPIGSRWLKPHPSRKLKLIKSTGDLLENGRSVKSQLGINAEEILRKWFVYFPEGGEVFVDNKSAAVVAFKKGDAHLIGWFGVEPNYTPGSIRGFFLANEYQFKEGDIVDLATKGRLLENPESSRAQLVADIAAQVSEGEPLFITDYGDVAIELEDGGFKKIAEADADSWFDGHLPR